MKRDTRRGAFFSREEQKEEEQKEEEDKDEEEELRRGVDRVLVPRVAAKAADAGRGLRSSAGGGRPNAGS